jgi:proton glutamate symport protein
MTSTPQAPAASKRGSAALAVGLLAGGALTASLAWLLGWPAVGFAGRWVLIAGLVLWAWRRRTLTSWILVSMVVGAEVGHDFPETATAMRLLSQIFIRMIKTIIAPLLFATLVVGIAGHPNLRHVGRMGLKALVYFEVVTTLALFIGLAAINISQAGAGIVAPAALESSGQRPPPQSLSQVILHAFPENVAKAVAEGHVLQIVVFSLIFAVALSLLPEEKRRPMLSFAESLAATMFKFTNIVMLFAPVGVGAAIAYTVGHMGVGILVNLAKVLATFYLALLAFLGGVLLPVALLAKVPIRAFARAIAEPVSIAFATTSSEAALPLAMERMEQFGVPRQTVAFVMPTGYSFNLDGSTLYLALASVFVAQAAGIELSFTQQLAIVLTLMITSKGVAGVPRAVLVILMGTASSFGLPEWPILVLLGIDELMDMARTSVNVIGNCLATVVIARWEGEYPPAAASGSEAG